MGPISLSVCVSVTNKTFEPSVMQHSSLLGLLVSYAENEELWIRPQAPSLGLKY